MNRRPNLFASVLGMRAAPPPRPRLNSIAVYIAAATLVLILLGSFVVAFTEPTTLGDAPRLELVDHLDARHRSS